MEEPLYYVKTAAPVLRVLRLLSETPANRRTLRGLVDHLARTAPELEPTEYKVRTWLGTLEAEGFLSTWSLDNGPTLYGPSPLLTALAHQFMDAQRQALREILEQTQRALTTLEIQH